MDKEYAMKYLTHIVVQVQKVSVVKIYFEVNMFDEKCLVLYKSKNLKFILLFYFLNKFLNYKKILEKFKELINLFYLEKIMI